MNSSADPVLSRRCQHAIPGHERLAAEDDSWGGEEGPAASECWPVLADPGTFFQASLRPSTLEGRALRNGWLDGLAYPHPEVVELDNEFGIWCTTTTLWLV